jgi:hypothetical protein
MLEGRIAALSALERLGRKLRDERQAAQRELGELRSGPFGERPRRGKEKLLSLMKEVALG